MQTRQQLTAAGVLTGWTKAFKKIRGSVSKLEERQVHFLPVPAFQRSNPVIA